MSAAASSLDPAAPRSAQVAVILAARNAEQTLAATLRSVQRQTIADWQCWIVDDHSTDTTLALAQQFSDSDPRFQVRRNQTPHHPESLQSLVAARNQALNSCRTPWIAILDADDLMHRRRLELQLAYAAAHQLDVVGSGVRYFPRRELGAGMVRYEDWLNHQHHDGLLLERFIEMPLAHPAMLIRRSLLTQIAGYRDCDWPEDYDLYLRLAAAGARIGKVPQRLLSWRHRPNSTSKTHPSYSLQAFARCRAQALADDFLCQSAAAQQGESMTVEANRPYVLWGYGDTGRELARNLAEHNFQPAAILELHPGRIGQRILGAPVYSPETYFTQAHDLPIVVSVAGLGPRRLIRSFFRNLHAEHGICKREGVDFIFAA